MGENTTLSCSAVGFPARNVDWTRDGVEVQGSSGIETKSLLQGPHTIKSSLTITSARVNLTEMYHCHSSNTIEGFPLVVV